METTLNGTDDLVVTQCVKYRPGKVSYHYLIYNLQTPSLTNCIQTRHMPIHLSGMLGELTPKSVCCRTIVNIWWCGVVKGAE